MSGCFAVAYHLINMIGDAIDLPRRIFDSLGRAIRGLRRFVGRDLRLCRGLFGVLGGLLSLGGGGFGLLGPLLVARCASRDRDRKNQKRQPVKQSSHPR